jgi:hypothetical protein
MILFVRVTGFPRSFAPQSAARTKNDSHFHITRPEGGRYKPVSFPPPPWLIDGMLRIEGILLHPYLRLCFGPGGISI